MKFSWKSVAAVCCSVLGAISWLYVGVYRLFKGPIKNIIAAKLAGTLTLTFIAVNFFKGFVCLTVAGFIWCLWYILKGYILRK